MATQEISPLIYLAPNTLVGNPFSVPAPASAIPFSDVASGAIQNLFNVKTYGAAGNGSTDDTSSINSAIAAFNAAGNGVLLFPSGAYLVSSSLTAITANGLILGMGMADKGNDDWGSGINYTSSSTALFTINSVALTFKDINLAYTGGTTPTSGSAAILVTSSQVNQCVNYDHISVFKFYIDIDIQVGAAWSMRGCIVDAAIEYCVRIQNTVNGDAGDWAISDCVFEGAAGGTQDLIHQLSSGGGKITNCKFNSSSTFGGFNNGYFGSTASTSDLLIANCSFENMNDSAMNVSGFGNCTIVGIQINGGGAAFNTDLMIFDGMSGLVIANVAATTGSGTVYAMNFSSCTNVAITNCVAYGSLSGLINPSHTPTYQVSPHNAFLDVADQTVSGGANVTSLSLGTKSSGTLTIDCGKCPLQYYTNGGAHTLAAPSNDGSCVVLITNNSSAGTISFSGFSEGSNTGDSLNTTNTDQFSIFIWRINGTSGYRVAAHQ